MKIKLDDKAIKKNFKKLSLVDVAFSRRLKRIRNRDELLELASGHERVAVVLRKLHMATED